MPTITSWLDRFFDAYHSAHPVNATFIGRHHVDHRLPDASEQGLGDRLAAVKALLGEAAGLDSAVGTPTEPMDLRLASGALDLERWELESGHVHQTNPAFYTGEAIFGVMGLFLTPFAPLADRVEAAAARLDAVPALLRQARGNLRQPPAAWIDRALRECRGAMAFLGEGIEHLIAEEGVAAEAVRPAAARAARAFEEYARFLDGELRASATDSYSCGEEALDRYLRRGHFLEQTADEIAEYAEAELSGAEAYLRDHATDHGASDPDDVLVRLADFAPAAEHYYARYADIWEASRAVVAERNLLPWPEHPIRFVPRPRWARAAAPDLYFLFYRSPAAFGAPSPHQYLVAPLPDGDALAQDRFLRANNDSVIKLNHVVHHGGIGHHVQNWHAARAPSRIGRIAAVDCASRIALFCGGTMAEGWACYATDLMDEAGFLTPLERYAERNSRRRMCARAVVDVRMHQGRLTLAEATRYYVDRAGMSPEAAFGESVKNGMFPGTGLMYLVATDAIHRLRRTMQARLGSRFDLASFHDRFLAYGSIPVALVAIDMVERLDASN